MTKSSSKNERHKTTPLDGQAGSLDEFQGKFVDAFESGVVECIFAHFKLPAEVKHQMLDEFRTTFGLGFGAQPRLVLPMFYSHYAEFPIYLVVKRFKSWTKTLTLSRAMNTFGRDPLVKAWETLADDIPEEFADKSRGIVHPWPNVAHGMVLHNRALDQERLKMPKKYKDEQGRGRARLLYETQRGELLTWEPLVNLLLVFHREEWKVEA